MTITAIRVKSPEVTMVSCFMYEPAAYSIAIAVSEIIRVAPISVSSNIKNPRDIISSDGAFTVRYSDGSLYTWGKEEYGGDKDSSVNGILKLSNLVDADENRYLTGQNLILDGGMSSW